MPRIPGVRVRQQLLHTRVSVPVRIDGIFKFPPSRFQKLPLLCQRRLVADDVARGRRSEFLFRQTSISIFVYKSSLNSYIPKIPFEFLPMAVSISETIAFSICSLCSGCLK